MGYLQAVVLGFIQGATEFLPVSSSGHLHIIPLLLGWKQQPMSFDIFVHAGTLIAVILYFWPEVVKYTKGLIVGIKRLFEREPQLRDSIFSYYILIAFIPAGILGYFFQSRIQSVINNAQLISYFFLVTALLLILANVLKGKKDFTGIDWLDALIIGIAQAIALIPGISRSGASITAGRMMGLNRESSARFSFLIAIPAIMGGMVYAIYKTISGDFVIFLGPYIVGFIVAAVVGWLSLHLFFKILKSAGFEPYIVYLILLFVVLQVVL